MRVLIVAAHFKHAFFEQMEKHARKSEIRIIPSEWWQGRTSITRIQKEIREFRPDLVYTDDTFSATIISKLTDKRIPVLIRLRGNWWIEFYDKLKWSWKHRLASPVNYAMNTLSFGWADGIVPICKWLETDVEKRYPGKSRGVVYQGVDPSLFFAQEGMEFSHPCVGIVQDHNIPAKVDGLIGFREVVQRLPDVQFKIAGGGNGLERVKKHYQAEKNVEVIGRVTYPEGLRKFYTSIDAYVLASGLDCCPTTVLEASLMKKPVLASAVGGVPEIIDQDKSGWSIPNQDTEEWVEKIELLSNSPSRAKKMGSYGRKWVSKNFGWDTVTRQVERIFIKEIERA